MDDDGYAVGDPYAEAAKKIDKSNKQGMMPKLAKKIIDNHETVSVYERYLKSALCIIILVFIVFNSDASKDENATWIPSIDFLKTFSNTAMLKDFMLREGLILLIVIGGFCLANKYNRYLDELDY